MSASDGVIWLEQFPYRRGVADVARLESGWRLEIKGRSREARDLVTAFEALTHKPAGKDELQVIATALAWNEAFHNSPSD
jgi:hypothetical protein